MELESLPDLSIQTEIKNSQSANIVKYISSNMNGNTFHHHFHILYDIRTIMGPKKKVYTEIGTYHGGSASLMLQHPFDTEFNIIDPMVVGSNQYEIYDSNIKKFNKHNYQINFFKNYSTDYNLINRLTQSNFKTDILFIDGDHSYNGVIFDFEHFSPFVNVGGYIVFDDYLDHKYSPEVKGAVDHIVKNVLDKYEIIGSLPNYQNAHTSYPVGGLNEFVIKKLA
jgi:cephalosporin hydroxylase